MIDAISSERRESSWMTRGAVFAAACGFLVAFGAGVDYVFAGVAQQTADPLRWLPKLALPAINLVAESFWNSGGLDSIIHRVTTASVDFVIVATIVTLGLFLRRRAAH